jgi:hypothetical protein
LLQLRGFHGAKMKELSFIATVCDQVPIVESAPIKPR